MNLAGRAALLAALFAAGSAQATGGPRELVVTLVADLDDDDDDGVADSVSEKVRDKTATDVRWLAAARLMKLTGSTGVAVRLLDGARPQIDRAAGKRLTRPGLQGLRAGKSVLELAPVARVGPVARTPHASAQNPAGLRVVVNVLEVRAYDAAGRPIDLATSHASIARTLPEELDPDREPSLPDVDSIRWTVVGPTGTVPATIGVRSTTLGGKPLDRLKAVALKPTACPEGVTADLECRSTPLIRATSDEIDSGHPSSAARSLQAEVGGRIVVEVSRQKAVGIRVGGPRHSAIGSIDRYRAQMRVFIVRMSRGGSVPIGGDEKGALAIARREARTASALWGQCGIHFGEDSEVKVVDPPPAHLLAVGCDLGLPASGGQLVFRADQKKIVSRLAPGDTPARAARRVAGALRKAGFSATVSPNARTLLSGLPTVDVLVRRQSGALVTLSPLDGAPLSSDPSLAACLGEVDLADGLTHFTDFDAPAGTVEERSLVKAFDDGDPSSIEVLIVPSFARTGRIGESFIRAEGASIRNAVILDRTGIRAASRSFALAHELGHVLLDMPGHPDDFGVDSPNMLMDADAADPTIFGPRRLSTAECVRSIRQSGPGGRVEILTPWPLYRTPTFSAGRSR